jgi:hypothetical protein
VRSKIILQLSLPIFAFDFIAMEEKRTEFRDGKRKTRGRGVFDTDFIQLVGRVGRE